jgi:small subunit ribosomal protein S8e
MPIHQKKRKFERGRQSSNTKLGENKKVEIKCRGNTRKRRALRVNEGNP